MDFEQIYTNTDYRKYLEENGYKTVRINWGNDIDYFAFKDNKYYYFMVDFFGEKIMEEENIFKFKAEDTERIIKAFKRKK